MAVYPIMAGAALGAVAVQSPPMRAAGAGADRAGLPARAAQSPTGAGGAAGPLPPRAKTAAAIIPNVSRWFRTYGFADVIDDLLIGAYPLDADDVRMLSMMGVRRVLNLVQDSEYPADEHEEVAAAMAAAGIEEHRVALADYAGLPPSELEAAVLEVNGWLDEGLRTYLHCRAGWQRSAAVAAGVVALRRDIDIDNAMAHVQTRKPSADPLPHQREDLRRWWDLRSVDPLAGDAGGGGRRAEAAADGGALDEADAPS